MRLFNTATASLERFRPRPGEPVRVYVCGITPYDTTHLGHAFTYTVFDVMVRHMETVHRWPVRYVQNLTDVDDDVLRRAAETGEDWQALGRRWARRFVDDMARLGNRPPERMPGATAYIADMRRDIGELLRRGAAYERDGGVYFRTRDAAGFGVRAGQGRDELLAIANERGNDPLDPNKEDPLDFVLWQKGKPGEPAWSSPWSLGRPGWHIECSTMSRALLGEQVDVHGGGGDLAFPHHACEEALCAPLGGPVPWVRFWVHTAMVRKDGEKMAKSLGNLVMVAELLERVEPDSVRLYLLRHHYRRPWEWDEAELDATAAWARTIHAAAARGPGTGADLDPATFGPRFVHALDDDLDTPAAIEIVLHLADAILEAPAGTRVAAAQDVLRTLAGRVLGLWLQPYATVSDDERRSAAWPDPETAAPEAMVPGAVA